jgi:hypothetical protein
MDVLGIGPIPGQTLTICALQSHERRALLAVNTFVAPTEDVRTSHDVGQRPRSYSRPASSYASARGFHTVCTVAPGR